MPHLLRIAPADDAPQEGRSVVLARLWPQGIPAGASFAREPAAISLLLLAAEALPHGDLTLLFPPAEEKRAAALCAWLIGRLAAIEKAKPRKAALRRAVRERADALAEGYRRAAGAAITAHLLADARYRSAEKLFVYVSLPKEPDTAAIIADALAAGKAVYVPKCIARHVMQAVRIRSAKELVPGTLGIPEPAGCGETASADALDLVLAPCAAVSRDGVRLGHGAAYYDAFLRGSETTAICLCFAELLIDEIPSTCLDVRMDDVLTENGFCTAGKF